MFVISDLTCLRWIGESGTGGRGHSDLWNSRRRSCTTIMGLMGTISTRFPGRRLEFDSASMRFTNVPEANALLRPDWSEAALSEWGRYL